MRRVWVEHRITGYNKLGEWWVTFLRMPDTSTAKEVKEAYKTTYPKGWKKLPKHRMTVERQDGVGAGCGEYQIIQ